MRTDKCKNELMATAVVYIIGAVFLYTEPSVFSSIRSLALSDLISQEECFKLYLDLFGLLAHEAVQRC